MAPARTLSYTGTVVFLMAALIGCAQPPAPLEALDPPTVEPEPVVIQDPTLLERFQEVSRLWENEAARARKLEGDLEQERARTAQLRGELERAQSECRTLRAKSEALAKLQEEYDAAQKRLLELSDALRQARRDLLQEKLARVKQEQALVSLKIATAQEQRKRLISGVMGQTGTPEDEGAIR